MGFIGDFRVHFFQSSGVPISNDANSHKKNYILLATWYILKHLTDYPFADFHAIFVHSN